MVRDFTQATKERLSEQIDDIEKNTWSCVTDAIGDAFLYAGKWLGIISLNDDMSNVQSYQRNVLDMTNTTKKDLETIFNDVYKIDNDYKVCFATINERETTYNGKLEFLYGVIQPNFSICSAQEIKSHTVAFDKKLKTIDGKINKDFEKELDWAAKEAALEATKGFFGSGLKIVVDVLTLPASLVKNIVTGNYLGIFTDTWSIIDDVFAVGGNLSGLAILGIGYGITALTGDKEDRHMAIQNAEAYAGVTGLTEALKADEEINGEGGFVTGFRKVSEKIDLVSDACGLFSDVKGFVEDPSSLIDWKFGFKTELGTIKKADMLDEYKDDYRKWQALYRRLGKGCDYVKLKNISQGYKYLQGLWDLPDGVSAPIENAAKTGTESLFKGFKTAGDAIEFGGDLFENIFGNYKLNKQDVAVIG